MCTKRKFKLISPIGWFIHHDWNLYSSFLNSLEPRVDEVVKDWVEATEREAGKIEDADQRAAFWDFHIDDYNDHLEFKTILLNSFFLSSFALFEYHLIEICERARVHHKTPFSVHDLRPGGPSLTETKKYLETLGVDFPVNSQRWQAITSHKWVRNRLVHEGGHVRDKKRLANAKKLGIVSDKYPHPRLELTKEFCDKALKDFQSFLLEIDKSYYRSIG